MGGDGGDNAPVGGESPTTDLPAAVRRQVWVVMPAYNEAARLGDVVREVRAWYDRVVVVDDGSADDSAGVARRAGAIVLQHAVNRGQGAALQTGIVYALRQGAAYLVTFDSDGQHDPADIAALVAPIYRGQWDISLGSRFLGRAENMTRRRRMLLKGGVLFTRAVSRVRISDAHNGLRAFSRRAAQRIDITLDRMAHASELIDQIRDCGFPFGEVPVHVHYTAYSVGKGQRGTNAVRIVFHYFLKRLTDY